MAIIVIFHMKPPLNTNNKNINNKAYNKFLIIPIKKCSLSFLKLVKMSPDDYLFIKER